MPAQSIKAYATVCDTSRTLSASNVFRRPTDRTYIKGRYVNCQRLQSFHDCLNLFGAKMVPKHRSVDEATQNGLRSVFQITFTMWRVFSPFLSLFFFSFQKKKSIKKSLTRYVGYLNCFRRLDKNGKTTEIHCMIASLQHPLQSMRNASSSEFMMFLYNLFKVPRGCNSFADQKDRGVWERDSLLQYR